jgi:uncharacterized protein YjlB
VAQTIKTGGEETETLRLGQTETFPNSRLPALVYRRVLPELGHGDRSPDHDRDLASAFESLFARNGWTGSWRNGLYRAHHYHSTAHEVLGVYRGNVTVRLGGPAGPIVELHAGDVVVIPAGVAHKNEAQSSDFAVVGAYPSGTSADLQYGKPSERPAADRNIRAVPKPKLDPVAGAEGRLVRLWPEG